VQTTAALGTNSIGGDPVVGVGSMWRELRVVSVSFILTFSDMHFTVLRHIIA